MQGGTGTPGRSPVRLSEIGQFLDNVQVNDVTEPPRGSSEPLCAVETTAGFGDMRGSSQPASPCKDEPICIEEELEQDGIRDMLLDMKKSLVEDMDKNVTPKKSSHMREPTLADVKSNFEELNEQIEEAQQHQRSATATD